MALPIEETKYTQQNPIADLHSPFQNEKLNSNINFIEL